MTRLERRCEQLLRTSAAGTGVSLTVSTTKQRPWASALFVGVHMRIALTSDDDGRFDEWLAVLPEIELPLCDHFVADAEVIERSANAATIELLLIEG